MAIVFHTKNEIIPIGNIQKKWNLDDDFFIQIIAQDNFTIFFATDVRTEKDIEYFIGYSFSYQDGHRSLNSFAESVFSVDAGLKSNGEPEVGETFLLKNEVLEYEKKNPYLLSKPIAPSAWQEHMQGFKDALPVPALNGGHSEELAAAQDQGEIARLKEQLAGHSAQAQGVDASQTEALELEKAAHARTREELAAAQARITGLERQLAHVQARAEGQEAALALPRYGAIKFVDDCYRAGLTPEQTAQELGRHGYKGPAICALLHPDVVGEGAKSITDQAQYGRDLKAGRVKGKKAW